MRYKLIALDLDGTLLNDAKCVSEVNQESIKLALQHGFEIVLASGRPHELMVPYAKQLGITTPLICCNGAYVYDQSSHERINESKISGQDLETLVNTLEECELQYTLYSENGIYANKPSKHIAGLEKNANALGVKIQTNIETDKEALLSVVGGVYKVLINSNDKTKLLTMRTFLSGIYQAELSEPTKLDVTNLDSDKGLALKFLLKKMGMNTSDVIAFGDGDNDKAMFSIVAQPVAMDNASPQLKAYANIIVTDNNGAGIGQYIRLNVIEGNKLNNRIS